MKRIIPALVFLGMIFTFTACGDDSSSSKSDDMLSCDQKAEWTEDGATFTRHICAEAVNTAEYRERLDVICAPSKDSAETRVKGTGCPGDAKIVCEGQKEGTFMYFYDEDDAHKSCEKLMARFEDNGGKDSDDSTDSSSVSDDLLACEIKSDLIMGGESFIHHSCVEVLPDHKNTLDKICVSSEYYQEPMVGTVTAIKMASCPGDAKKVCHGEGDAWYYYNDEDVPENCEELAADYDNSEEDDGSSDGEP